MIRISVFLGSITCLTGPATWADDRADGGTRPLLVVHYMPWFASKEVSGDWGWHWTMGHFNPERSDASGKRQIASHYYPTIGPYDSGDPDVLEYHTLLMKVAGIDGAIADWYGNEEFNDYLAIHRNTVALFDTLKLRKMKFAVCYEDRVLKAMAEKKQFTPAQAIEHAQTHLLYCENQWFADPLYLTWHARPLFLVFGPDYLQRPQWETVFAGMRNPPTFLTLHERRAPAAGSFAWPPMWKANAGKLETKDLDSYFDAYDARVELKIAGAFPGFHDIYQEAGVQPSHGRLDSRGGETFHHTLERAFGSKTPFVQIITWNDFGEGTCVEPAREYGYRYLEAVQQARRQFPNEPFPYRPADLRLPLRIYQIRKRVARSSPDGQALDRVVDRLFAADITGASRQLDTLSKSVPRE
jgi:hypothetical protein